MDLLDGMSFWPSCSVEVASPRVVTPYLGFPFLGRVTEQLGKASSQTGLTRVRNLFKAMTPGAPTEPNSLTS